MTKDATVASLPGPTRRDVFHRDSRVAIRSSACPVVKSGETASFDAGNEIPAIGRIGDTSHPGRQLHQRPPTGDIQQDQRAAGYKPVA